jgi:predicted kinase
LDHVALLAEADVRGRVCADHAQLIERVDLFRLFCREHGCYDRPFAFADDQSRIAYFRSPHRDPHYAAHDTTWGEVIVLSGLPGAGKDTWIMKHAPHLPVVALDTIRRELNIGPDDDQGTVVRVAKERARALLRARQPFVWNATNITRSLRGPLIDLITDYGARARLVYIDVPFDVLRRRNRVRTAMVPDAVIGRLIDKLDVPDRTEAHRVEYVYA